jgi:hypothetical protein
MAGWAKEGKAKQGKSAQAFVGQENAVRAGQNRQAKMGMHGKSGQTGQAG